MDPHNPDLVAVVVSQQAMLLLAYLVGRVTRRLLAGRITISTSAATLTTLVGLWIGLLIAGFLFDDDRLWTVRSLSAAALVAALTLTVTALVLARLQRVVPLEPIAQVAKAGESESLEFKSSARWNMRTGRRDEAMENVVVKTVAAFLNSFGGTLLLGVDDAGTLIGLAPDFSTLKQPDADRYELWLRDLWRTRLGTTAALPGVDFAPTPDGTAQVCRVTVPPSPRPVYASAGAGDRAVGAGGQLDPPPGGRRRCCLRHAPVAGSRPGDVAQPPGRLPALPQPPGRAGGPGPGHQRRRHPVERPVGRR